MSELFPTDNWIHIGFYIYLGVLFLVLLPIAQWATWRADRPDPELDKANAEYARRMAEPIAMVRRGARMRLSDHNLGFADYGSRQQHHAGPEIVFSGDESVADAKRVIAEACR